MRAEDKGINPKTGQHMKLPLTRVESAFLGVIWVDHVGRDNALAGKEFCERWVGRMGVRLLDDNAREEFMRGLREMQNHLLIEHNIPVYSVAGNAGGYYIGEGRADAEEFYDSFRKRGLTGLIKASRGKQSAMVDMITQLSFEWQDLVDKTFGSGERRAESKEETTPIEVVDAFLRKMMQNPGQFSEGLKKLGEKYGSVLVPRDRFDAMIAAVKVKAVELQELARSLES